MKQKPDSYLVAEGHYSTRYEQSLFDRTIWHDSQQVWQRVLRNVLK